MVLRSDVSSQDELAGETLRTMCKRFSGVREVWLLHLTFLIRQGKDEARKLVYERALNALPPKEAVQVGCCWPGPHVLFTHVPFLMPLSSTALAL